MPIADRHVSVQSGGAGALVQQAQCLHEGLHRLGDRRGAKHLHVPGSTSSPSSASGSTRPFGAPPATAASSSVIGTWSASALRFLGEQHKAHHREETENRQTFEVLHDVPFDPKDIFFAG